MNTRELSRMSSQLEGLFARRQWHAIWLTFTIGKRWQEIAGPDVGHRSRPAVFQKHILWVDVQDSAWMQQLQTMKSTLLERLQLAFPEADIRDIRWRMQQAEFQPAENRPDRGSPGKIDTEQAKAFARLAATIDNQECRDALYRLWLSFHQLQEQ